MNKKTFQGAGGEQKVLLYPSSFSGYCPVSSAPFLRLSPPFSTSLSLSPSVSVCNNNPTVDMSVTLHGSINAIITCNQRKEAHKGGLEKAGAAKAGGGGGTGHVCHMANVRKESPLERLTKEPKNTGNVSESSQDNFMQWL